MSARLKLKGQKFGRLLVIDFFRISERNKAIWKTLCDCGNIVYAESYSPNA